MLFLGIFYFQAYEIFFFFFFSKYFIIKKIKIYIFKKETIAKRKLVVP